MENKNNNREYDGVIYEPSHAQPSADVRPAKTAPPRKQPPRKKPAKKSNFGIFYAITILLAVVVCLVLFFTMFSSFTLGTGQPKPTATPKAAAVGDVTPPPVVADSVEVTAVALSVSSAENSITFLDVANVQVYKVFVDDTTTLRNQYNQPLSLTQISPGSVYDTAYNPKTSLLSSARGDAAQWERNEISNVQVDTDNNTVTFGNTTYNYNKYLVTYADNKTFDISGITADDTVTLRGYGDTLWYVGLVRGHATLNIKGADKIVNGTIEVGTTLYKAFADGDAVTVPEGTLKVVIHGDNILPYTTEIVVKNGESQDLDLSVVPIIQQKCTLTILVDQTGYVVTINGVQQDLTVPIMPVYGDYTVSVEKDGFDPYVTTVTLNSPTYELDVTLTPAATPVPEPTEAPTPMPTATPAPTPAPQMQTFSVNSDPSGVQVYVDNILIGITPLTTQVTRGQHTVMFRLDGYVPVPYYPQAIDIEDTAVQMNVTMQSAANAVPPSDTDTLTPDTGGG